MRFWCPSVLCTDGNACMHAAGVAAILVSGSAQVT